MRRPLAALLMIPFLQAAACDDPKKLKCSDSIAHACASGQCVLTWEEARGDTGFCSDAALAPPRRADCGGYHVVTTSYPDVNVTYYYDAATGALVAIVQAGFGGTGCDAGPADGFTRPTCAGAGSEPLLQCLDGGADAAGADGATD